MSKYARHTWKDGEVITPDKMNNIETGVAEAKKEAEANSEGLKNKAPAGYGYGEQMEEVGTSSSETYAEYCAKIDALLAKMPDRTTKLINAAPPYSDAPSFGACAAVLYRGSNAYASLIPVGHSNIYAYGWRMQKRSGIWQPFEWIDPPLDANVEYRTIERMNGKAVYKKRLSSGVIQYRLDGETAWNDYAPVFGAAPAGFGLGAVCVEIDDWNNATKAGWYKGKTNSADGNWMFGFAVPYNDGTIIQHAFAHGNGTPSEAIRLIYGGTPKEWEWVNPPMQVGVEYRTTERWQGKPVYTRLVSCGELPPVGQSKEVGIYKSGVTNVLEICGTMSTGDCLPYLNYSAYSTATPNSQINFTATKSNIKIATVAWGAADVAVTSITATARIKYVYS